MLLCRDTQLTIFTPQTNYFVKNETSIRLCYLQNDQYKYINLATPLEVAQFLKKNGEIDWFSSRDDYKVRMYKRDFQLSTGTDMQPIQKQYLKLISWAEISLTADQVQTYAARYEVGINKFVKDFIKQHFNAA